MKNIRHGFDDDGLFGPSAVQADAVASCDAAVADAAARLADLPVQVAKPFGMVKAGYVVVMYPAAHAMSGRECNLPLSASDEAAIRQDLA